MRYRKMILALIAIVLVTCGLAVLLPYIYHLISMRQQSAYAHDIGTRLGLGEEALFYETWECRDLPSRCGTYVRYETGLSSEQLQQRIQQLGMSHTDPRRITGTFIFADLGGNLTVNGKSQAQSTYRQNLQPIRGETWNIKDKDIKSISVAFYSTAHSTDVYEFKSRKIEGNIVVIVVEN